MEGVGALGILAVAFAGAAGSMTGTWAWSRGRRLVRVGRSLGFSDQDRAASVGRALGRPFLAPARALLRIEAVQEMASAALACLKAEGRLQAEAYLSALLGLCSLVGIASFALTSSAAFAVAASCLCFVGSWLYVRHEADKAACAMREETPDALRSLADSFRSGHSLLQTMQQASVELEGGLGSLFASAAHSLEMGETTSRSLSALRAVKGVPELAFVAVALDIQHQSGGSIAPVLESARASVEGELELARSLRVQTAQAKLSASIVTIMPFVLVAFFSLASPGFLAPFFASGLGLFLLAMALVMQVAGVLAVRRICRVD